MQTMSKEVARVATSSRPGTKSGANRTKTTTSGHDRSKRRSRSNRRGRKQRGRRTKSSDGEPDTPLRDAHVQQHVVVSPRRSRRSRSIDEAGANSNHSRRATQDRQTALLSASMPLATVVRSSHSRTLASSMTCLEDCKSQSTISHDGSECKRRHVPTANTSDDDDDLRHATGISDLNASGQRQPRANDAPGEYSQGLYDHPQSNHDGQQQQQQQQQQVDDNDATPSSISISPPPSKHFEPDSSPSSITLSVNLSATSSYQEATTLKELTLQQQQHLSFPPWQSLAPKLEMIQDEAQEIKTLPSLPCDTTIAQSDNDSICKDNDRYFQETSDDEASYCLPLREAKASPRRHTDFKQTTIQSSDGLLGRMLDTPRYKPNRRTDSSVSTSHSLTYSVSTGTFTSPLTPSDSAWNASPNMESKAESQHTSRFAPIDLKAPYKTVPTRQSQPLPTLPIPPPPLVTSREQELEDKVSAMERELAQMKQLLEHLTQHSSGTATTQSINNASFSTFHEKSPVASPLVGREVSTSSRRLRRRSSKSASPRRRRSRSNERSNSGRRGRKVRSPSNRRSPARSKSRPQRKTSLDKSNRKAALASSFSSSSSSGFRGLRGSNHSERRRSRRPTRNDDRSSYLVTHEKRSQQIQQTNEELQNNLASLSISTASAESVQQKDELISESSKQYHKETDLAKRKTALLQDDDDDTWAQPDNLLSPPPPSAGKMKFPKKKRKPAPVPSITLDANHSVSDEDITLPRTLREDERKTRVSTKIDKVRPQFLKWLGKTRRSSRSRSRSRSKTTRSIDD